jgi:RNA-directed DNA polymerase
MERIQSVRVVAPSEGNEARRHGAQEVGALRSTEEAGEHIPVDPVEGREGRTTEPLEGKMMGVSEPNSISTRLQRIAELARETPKMVLHSLSCHVDVDWMREAYRRTRKDGATGVDGQTAQAYARSLDHNLQTLHERFKSGLYRAPPVRRVHIPKGDGSKTRPIGIPTFEDKVLQRAVVMVLDEIYEQDFLDCSYGFRRNRSAHQALEALHEGLMKMHGGVVLELDIESFFDSVDRAQLRSFLDQRIRDGVLCRAIGKWLNAGVLEEGALSKPDSGTPQGGVISPLLANIYLHEVLDTWFERDVKPRLRGKAFMIRYADDVVLAFSNEADAHKVYGVIGKRFAKYGLRLHPEKTRLVEFRRPSRHKPGAVRPGTFDFLGFTHYWGVSHKGNNVIKRKTSRQRFRRALQRAWAWCKQHRHRPVSEQHAQLCRKLLGHYAYYGITSNGLMLSRFRQGLRRYWRYWLDRRSQRARMSWERFASLLQRYPLPYARVVHSLCRVANP